MILAIIPAKENSKRLPGKNLKEFCGEPLISRTIKQAKASKVDFTVVATDSNEIRDLCWRFGVMPFPAGEFPDGVPGVVQFVVEKLKGFYHSDPVYIVTLQCTSPLRTVQDIDNAIEMMLAYKPECVDSRCNGKQNGAIYIHRKDTLDKFDSCQTLVYEMPPERSVDIDTLEDFDRAEALA